jgi:hypothetical protein
MACDTLGAHLMLVQAERDPARAIASEKFVRDALPRIRMQTDYITSGDKLVMEKREQLV